MEYLTHLNETH